jgi:CubicO group peptidase (beta-lactamase class C family)
MKYVRTSNTLLSEAITVVKNDQNIIPFSYPDTLDPVVLMIGTESPSKFESGLTDFFQCKVHRLKHDAKIPQRQKILTDIEDNDLVIIAIVNTNILASRKFGISESDIQFIEQIARKKAVVLDVFASPYCLNFFSSTAIFKGLVVSYQDKPEVQQLSAEVMLGMHAAKGKLPVSAGGYPVNSGISTKKLRLSYASPEELAISSYFLDKIDSVALDGIAVKAFPGCQIIAAKDGYIFYDKSFGYHTYDEKQKVNNDDVYDLASLTKILATTPALMKMVDELKIDINGKLSDYLFYLKNTDKESIEFRDVLTHQSGFFPWIPYYENTLFENEWDTAIYRSRISEEFPIRVANNMYINKNYHYSIFQQIIESPLGEKEYAYSDLGFYFFKEMLEQLINSPFEQYVHEAFYHPLGLKTLTYKPLGKISKNRIIPTENDMVFRHQLLIGDVHDQGAAMLGGISGHAGLFGNAYDVAVMMQMFLNGGNYGGRKFISKETVKEFTKVQFPENDNRRGLGFDKPLLEYEEHLGNCKDASPSSFGHSGFTGTYAWADPESGLVYVFLSNRVYPDMNNTKIMDLDIRTNIHQLFYEAIKSENLTKTD